MSAITPDQVARALRRAGDVMMSLRDRLNELDAAMGDGDTGISVSKGGAALIEYVDATPLTAGDDVGKYLANAGMALNRAAPSTMGTLLATALMRMGREAKGASELDAAMLARMILAADVGIQERGKAKPGDKTIVDALHPAAVTFASAMRDGVPMRDAAEAMADAARRGRDAATPLRSAIGRASWVGERTQNQVDPGTELCVRVLEALAAG